MKILWVNPNFLHPTTKGGQIRTLEILKRLHCRHEIHYVARENPGEPEGPGRSHEYATRSYGFRHLAVDKLSPAFYLQLAAGLFSTLPLAVSRFYSAEMAQSLRELRARENFDRVVCDFLVSAVHFDSLEGVFLFQHNVETNIWLRHVENEPNAVRRRYFGLQARRMFAYERRICRDAGGVIAVSPADAETMRSLFGITGVADIPTGVDTEFFCRPPSVPPVADLVFVGSMDWLPNIDGMRYFIREILPLIRARKPDCSVAVVGRSPSPEVLALAREAKLRVTGTVPDIRPFLWGSAVSIVPLRIGGGTRLKIYESMAAGVPVVSTAVGAEGLEYRPGENIRIADTPGEFAAACCSLLDDQAERRRLSAAAREMVCCRFSWEQVARRFERILESEGG